MKFFYLLSIILFFIVYQTFAQAPGIRWQKCIGGSWNEAMYDLNGEMNSTTYWPVGTKGLIPAKEGGYFIAGQTNSGDGDVPVNAAYNQPGTIAVLRLDEFGNTLWKKTLGGVDTTYQGKYDQFRSIIQTSDRGCIVIGETANTTGQATGNHGKNDIILGKFSSSGNLEWSKTFGGTENEYGTSIVQTGDSGYVFLGSTFSTSGQVQGNHGLSDVWMVKIDKTGNIEWQKCIGTEGNDGAVKIEKRLYENLIYIWQSANRPSLTISQIDGLGNTISEASLPSLAAFGGMSATSDGGYIIAGQGPNQSGLAIKIDKDAKIQWQKELNGSKNDMFSDAKQTSDGGFIVCGNSESIDGDLTDIGAHPCLTCYFPKADAWIVKLNATGQVEWQKLFGGTGSDITATIFPARDNDYIFFGTTISNNGDVSGRHLSRDTNNPTVDWWLVNLSAINRLQGQVFEDVNRNGIKDEGEQYANNVGIKSVKGRDQRLTIPSNGHFINYIDTGSYTTTITPDNPYYTAQPSTRTTSFSTYNNVDTLNIALQPLVGKRDASINLIPLTPARPGFGVEYKLFYKNQGTDTIANGTVQLIKSNKLTLLSATPAYTSINSDTLRWEFSGLKPQDKGNITLNFTIAPPPSVNIGDALISTATIINTTDLTPADNTSKLTQTVTGSYDPNDKTEIHGGTLTPKQLANNEWLQYTIRFQNTGTDTAFNVSIRDTLSSKLDWNTLQMVSASHNYQLNIKDGNNCTWQFNNINLVDSNRNESKSHGYIVYRIKPSSTFAAGDTIKNTAGIYFDYNLPVGTNTEKTVLQSFSLPVTLISFEATKAAEANSIHWTTSAEINVSSFEVERSTDGRIFFTIGNVMPFGNGSSSNYQLNDDKRANRINYYRLKIIDKDGSVRYSTVKIIDNSVSYTISAFPNPATNKLSLKIDSDKNTDVQIEVIDQDGKAILTSRVHLAIGSTYHNINVTSFASGSYYVKLKTSGQQSILKFEKL